MAQYGHLTTLDAAECRLLLASRSFGRVAWNSPSGVEILPVSYGLVDDLIVFRTAVGSQLARLAEPVEVSFQVDDLDAETSTGWSVQVHGLSGAPVTSLPEKMPPPWPPGDRPVVIGILPDRYVGRSVAAR